jgi:FtsZ-interacting cell division protein ZipA
MKASVTAAASPIGKILIAVGAIFIVISIALFLDWLIRGKNYVYCFKSKKSKETIKVKANNTQSNINLVNKKKSSSKSEKIAKGQPSSNKGKKKDESSEDEEASESYDSSVSDTISNSTFHKD